MVNTVIYQVLLCATHIKRLCTTEINLVLYRDTLKTSRLSGIREKSWKSTVVLSDWQKRPGLTEWNFWLRGMCFLWSLAGRI